jgi:hypothetical protein
MLTAPASAARLRTLRAGVQVISAAGNSTPRLRSAFSKLRPSIPGRRYQAAMIRKLRFRGQILAAVKGLDQEALQGRVDPYQSQHAWR